MVERRLRLRRESDVQRTRARGKAYADGPLVVRVLANQTEPPQNRYTVVAGKRVGKAVQRSRLKRLVREAIRHLHPNLAPGHDIVVVVRGSVEELTGLDVAQRAMERTAKRAGLLSPSALPARTSKPAADLGSASPATIVGGDAATATEKEPG